MYTSESNGQPGKGRMLVFKGAGTIGIDKYGQNGIFGCGIFAPFANVLHLGDRNSQQNNHVEFTIVAKSYMATGTYASSAQLHGYVYSGPWPEGARPTDTRPGAGDLTPSPPPPPPPSPAAPAAIPLPPLCTADGDDQYAATGDGVATPCCDNSDPCLQERGPDDRVPEPRRWLQVHLTLHVCRLLAAASPPPPSPEPPAGPPPSTPPASPTPSMPPAVPLESPQTPPATRRVAAAAGIAASAPEPSPPPPHPDAPGTPTEFKCQCTFTNKCTMPLAGRQPQLRNDGEDPRALRLAGRLRNSDALCVDQRLPRPHPPRAPGGRPVLGDCYSSKACVSNPRCAALGLGATAARPPEGQMLSCCEEKVAGRQSSPSCGAEWTEVHRGLARVQPCMAFAFRLRGRKSRHRDAHGAWGKLFFS